jgi:hypothetical protein
MANVTLYKNGDPIAQSAGANAASLPMHTVFESTYDSTRKNLAIADVVTEFIKIPAGSFVQHVQVQVIVPEAAVTLLVGDAGDPNGFADAVALSAAAGTRVAGAGAYQASTAVAKYYDADTWLQFTIGGAAATVAKFKVSVAVCSMG